MKTSRRSFLETTLTLPALLEVTPALAEGPRDAALAVSKDSSFDPWVEIHRENVRNNVQEISRRVEARPILAVIKNNGYGAGVTNIAQLLEPQNEIFGFAVVKFHEAMSLRDAGIRKPVLLLGPFDEENLADAAARNIMPMVYTPQGPALDKIAASAQKPVPLHICIDTGIGRVGVPHYVAAPLVRDLASRKSVQIQGTMMTFAEDPDFDKEQLRRFHETCSSLEKDGIALGKKHAASSFTLFQYSEAFLDMVRPGMAIYGIYSENEFRHADGWPRTAALSGNKGAKVRINNELFPVVASVSASHCIVEIGREERVKIGDLATFFDAQPGSRPEDISESCGASVYDLTMHLNPLLPRRII